VEHHAMLALSAGYRDEMAASVRTHGVSFTWGPEDERLIAAHPIVDHTAQEHAQGLADGLAFALQGAVAAPIVGGAGDPALGAAKVKDLSLRWATQVATLVADAYHSGVTAAVLEVGRALAAERGNDVPGVS
jgi:hypothetical protein